MIGFKDKSISSIDICQILSSLNVNYIKTRSIACPAGRCSVSPPPGEAMFLGRGGSPPLPGMPPSLLLVCHVQRWQRQHGSGWEGRLVFRLTTEVFFQPVWFCSSSADLGQRRPSSRPSLGKPSSLADSNHRVLTQLKWVKGKTTKRKSLGNNFISALYQIGVVVFPCGLTKLLCSVLQDYLNCSVALHRPMRFS